MVSLQFELAKRSIKGRQYSICILCLNELLLRYDRETSISKILSYIDNEFIEMELKFDNLFDICIYLFIARNKIPYTYINNFINMISQNCIMETLDLNFMGRFGIDVMNYRDRNDNYSYLVNLISRYCDNPDDQNIVLCLVEFDNLMYGNKISSSEHYINDCIDYFARCNVYNEQPIQTNIMRMLKRFTDSKISFPTYYHTEMLKLIDLLNNSLYNPTTDSIHSLFQHPFFEKSKLSCESKYLYYRKKHEEQHVKETVEKIKHYMINEEAKIIEIEKTLQILKKKMTNISSEENELFTKINMLLIEVMISIKNQIV